MPRAVLEDHLRGASNDWRRMTSVPQLFPQTLAEAWDSLDLIPVSECKETNSSNGRVINGSYLLPWQTAKPKRRRNEPVVAYLIRELCSVLVRSGMRYLGQNPNADARGLTCFLFFEAEEACEKLERKHAAQLGGLTIPVLYQLHSAETAARMASENFQRDEYTALQRKATAAGKKGRKYDLEAYLATAHLSVAAAARVLGISRPTVYAMRREYAVLAHERVLDGA